MKTELRDEPPPSLPDSIADWMGRRMEIDRPRYATVATGDTARKVGLIHGQPKRKATPSTFIYVLERADSTYRFGATSVGFIMGRRLADTVEVSFPSEPKKAARLEVQIPPSGEVLLYRWLDGAGEAASTPALRPNPARSRFDEEAAAPAFAMQTLDGDTLRLDDLRGKTVVLNWWTRTCGPCVVEMPGLNQLVDDYANREDIVFVAVADNSPDEVRKFLEEVQSFAYRQTVATESAREVFGKAYPEHIIIGADGTVVYQSTGGSRAVHEELDRILRDRVLDGD